MPQQRFMLGRLAALGLLLFLGNAAAADTVINVPPTNQTVCAGSPAIFAVDAAGDGLTYQWQMSTDGGATFANISDTATNASYTNLVAVVTDPSYQYQVIVSSSSSPPVTTPSPAAVLTVNPAATASAGADRSICAGNDTGGLGGSVGGAGTGGAWSSSGSGTFSPDATTLNAAYVPSAADQVAGSVTLTLTATGQLPPCVASARVLVTILAAPAIIVQPLSRTNCPGTPAVFSVTAMGAGLSYQWQVSADGGTTFTNISNTATNASFTNVSPTLANDSGLQYQVVVSGTCPPAQTSTPPAKLSIYTPATVSAGGAQTICAGYCTSGLGGSVGGGAVGGRWSSPTAGTFSPNATTLNATYCASAADSAAGSVTLTLTAQPCADATAQVVVTINPTPAAPTTTGDSVCVGGVAHLSATGSGGALNWYVDPGLTTWVASGPTYQASPAQTTTYYVTETGSLGCVSPARPVTATVLNGPDSVNAGPHQALALSMTNAIRLAGSLANGATSPRWSGGSGTFSPMPRRRMRSIRLPRRRSPPVPGR